MMKIISKLDKYSFTAILIVTGKVVANNNSFNSFLIAIINFIHTCYIPWYVHMSSVKEVH